jgi:CubicO group peptidase (beta-lactamase class C family)
VAAAAGEAVTGPTSAHALPRQVIELPLPDSDIVLRLVRLGRGDAGAEEMFPSPPPAYAAPPAGDDGWSVASLAEVGASSAPLERMSADLARQVPGTWSDLAVHSVVVARRGKLVFEQYFAGYQRDDVHDIRSAGKSFTSTLAGIAVDRRELRLDDSVTALVGSPPNADARWARVKLRHLISMSAGLACDDDAADSPGNEDRVQDGAERDWFRATLALPMAREPGAVGVYCTMGINLTGALLARRSGAWLPEQLIERLVRPLQMRGYFLNLMPTGQGYLGGGLRLRPRDMAKLGQLFVDKGLWNGKRLLSASWVAQATAAQASLSSPDDYGYGWWRRSFEYDRASYPAFYASGNGGQLIVGIPALEAVIVFTAGNYGNRRTWQRLLDDYVPRYVIPALLGRP